MSSLIPHPSSLDVARGAASEPHLCFLDSAREGERSLVLWSPAAVYRTKDGKASLSWRDGRSEPADPDPFRFPGQLLSKSPDLLAAGYWSYDARYYVERLPRLAGDDLHLPDAWIGFYDRGCSYDHAARAGVFFGPGGEPRRAPAGEPPHFSPYGPLRDTLPRAEYEERVRRVLAYIAAGDCYQVNLSHRLTAPLPCSPWALYERLRTASPAPYAAYLDCGDHQVLSSSPELFLRIRGREVETRPIKGTRPRGANPEEDARLKAELLSSAKDRAELLMIVDLERNDLGRVCEYGSVEVPGLFEAESYANVHHLVATVRGRLIPKAFGTLDCLRAAFPGGSVTGAPKIRAMEIIEELEPTRRGVYTGAIGWMDSRGGAEWNIAIRTMVTRDGEAHLSTGGGIVADSEPGAEFDETMTKAKGMLQALGADQAG